MRVFSVTQFYHFAFMIVSMALLGFGASGTVLSIFPVIGKYDPLKIQGVLSLTCGIAILGAYSLTNWLPFDSFSVAWDKRQLGVLILHYCMLSLPFFISGLAVANLFAQFPHTVGKTYAANLTGSAVGCVIALVSPIYFGGEGTLILSSNLAILASVICLFRKSKLYATASSIIIFLFLVFELGSCFLKAAPPPWLKLHLSPYKSLSYTMQYPGAQITFQGWNSFSRVDLVRSQGIRSLPGLSFRYLKPSPPESGILVDGDDLSPLLLPGFDPKVFEYLPAAIAFQLREQGDALILEPRGGLDILTALNLGAERVTAVEANPLIIQAASEIYGDQRLTVIQDTTRSYIRRSKEKFDVVVLSLTSSYHPVHSGAYTLSEDYRYTVESFTDTLERLDSGGLLVVTRWLQTPPSEELRLFVLAVTALENLGGDPHTQIVAYRGYNTATLLVKKDPFTPPEMDLIRQSTSKLALDLIYAPDIYPEETNRYNILPEPVYFQTFKDLLNTYPRKWFYQEYPYQVSPPTDDRPFFGHFFKWSQTEQILAELGKTWQPFGGAGYFVILALLIITSGFSVLLILMPMVISQFRQHKHSYVAKKPGRNRYFYFLFYFGSIGLAFLLVEISLIQQFILFLGHPAYAFSTVLFTLLLFSGLGSLYSNRFPQPISLGILVILLIFGPLFLPIIFNHTLGLNFLYRVGLTVAILAPLGFLMGLPFPQGISWVLKMQSDSALSPIPWVWAVNGAISVIASVLAALLALSLGFGWVLRLGALSYAIAWLTIMASLYWKPTPRPLL